MSPTPLGLDEDTLVACVACGLCLPHCPTYRVTGLEIASPRGRIAAMRAVEQRSAPIDDAFLRAMDECVQCRGCEAACPSGVQFGHLMEDTRAAVLPQRRPPRLRRGWPNGSRTASCCPLTPCSSRSRGACSSGSGCISCRSGSASRGITRRGLRPLDVPVGGDPDAWLFTGCVMDAWMRDTHRTTAARDARRRRAHRATGTAGGTCCGALHVHAGRDAEARALARRVDRVDARFRARSSSTARGAARA